ncbi:MAG: hypothetical protein AAF322_21060, partial [Pseudomonadota bacterium]
MSEAAAPDPTASNAVELRLRDLARFDAPNSSAEAIDLRGPGVLTPRRARSLARAGALKELRLHSNVAATREALAALTRSETIVSLTISGLVGGGSIGALPAASGVETIYDNSHAMTAPDLAALASLPRLERLHAQGAKVSNAAARALAGAPRLKALDLEGAAFAPGAIRSLLRSDTLEELSLGHARLTPRDL